MFYTVSNVGYLQNAWTSTNLDMFPLKNEHGAPSCTLNLFYKHGINFNENLVPTK